jgi:hypothetical protein
MHFSSQNSNAAKVAETRWQSRVQKRRCSKRPFTTRSLFTGMRIPLNFVNSFDQCLRMKSKSARQALENGTWRAPAHN